MINLITAWRHFLSLMNIEFVVSDSLSTSRYNTFELIDVEVYDSDRPVLLVVGDEDSNTVLVDLKEPVNEGYIVFQATGYPHHLMARNRLVSYLDTEYYQPVLQELTRNLQLLQISYSFMNCSNKECSTICLTSDNHENGKCPNCRIGGRLEVTRQGDVVNSIADKVATSFITEKQIHQLSKLPNLDYITVMLAHQKYSQESGIIIDGYRVYTPTLETIGKEVSMSIEEVKDCTEYLVKKGYIVKHKFSLFKKQEYALVRDNSEPRFRITEAQRAFTLFVSSSN